MWGEIGGRKDVEESRLDAGGNNKYGEELEVRYSRPHHERERTHRTICSQNVIYTVFNMETGRTHW